MSPLSLANASTLEKRRAAVDLGHTTTHLPHEFHLAHDEDEVWTGGVRLERLPAHARSLVAG